MKSKSYVYLRPEVEQRMEGLVHLPSMSNARDAVYNVAVSLMEEGFEIEDILKFIIKNVVEDSLQDVVDHHPDL